MVKEILGKVLESVTENCVTRIFERHKERKKLKTVLTDFQS